MLYFTYMSAKSIKNLVIVESPAKAKNIGGYLGKDYTVMASVGHIRSIAKKAPKGQKAIDTDHHFETIYEIDPEKKSGRPRTKGRCQAS